MRIHPVYQLLAQTASRRAFCTSSLRTQRVIDHVPLQQSGPLRKAHPEFYPRLGVYESKITCADFVHEYQKWAQDGVPEKLSMKTVYGRISRIRSAGGKLIFVDVVADNAKVQGVGNLRLLQDVAEDQFRECFQRLKRGDIIRLDGIFLKTSSGKPSIQIKKLPELLSSFLHQVPTDLRDSEVLIAKRNIESLVQSEARSLLRVRSHVTNGIREFLHKDGYIEVQTPILAVGAGGATARSFRTHHTELDRELALRISPELWLKRMVINGFDRIFEIGPAFRNEGIDSSHNPEFTMCEFYRAYTRLEELLCITEEMFHQISNSITALELPDLPPITKTFSTFPYKRIDFVTGIEQAIAAELPLLSTTTAFEDLKKLVKKIGLPIDIESISNLPQLLDKICSEVLEPSCEEPTFIINHPECMSPLAKSFEHPSRPGQIISARAELFVRRQELANMYEEENSPFEQRRKFEEQLKHKGDPEGVVDEAYIEALEWGLPPTGGWGCGIERLVMAMTNTHKIGDVLSFGTLRNVCRGGKKS